MSISVYGIRKPSVTPVMSIAQTTSLGDCLEAMAATTYCRNGGVTYGG